VDRRAAVHRDHGDRALPQQRNQQRPEAHLDDVPAQHRDTARRPAAAAT